VKLLIAILSCHALRSHQQSIRDTWVKEIPEWIDYKFFLGEPKQSTSSDEVALSVGDTLQDLTHKTVAMCAWALGEEYDYVFKCDLDTLVKPTRLLQCGFEQHDWVGGQNSFFASGGAGYTLSKKAMKIIVEHKVEEGPAEDVNTAHALLEKGIALHHDSRFLFIPGQVMDDNTITYHLSSVKSWTAKSSPEEMYQAWNNQKTRNYSSMLASKRPIRFRRLRCH
jgi:hypothetical protein